VNRTGNLIARSPLSAIVKNACGSTLIRT
jgi:hypothetical protein